MPEPLPAEPRNEAVARLFPSAQLAQAPWDRFDGCFGHCDPEGWHAPCRDRASRGACSTPGCGLGYNHGGDRCNTFASDGHP
jgi:hypothetical protein